jgi:hypothetical protein
MRCTALLPQRALLALALLAAPTSGCAGDDTCNPGFEEVGDRCVPIEDAGLDASVTDASDAAVLDEGIDEGVDAGPPDAGPCGMTCPAATPVCDVATGNCVECTAAEDGACEDATPVCNAATNTCVACVASTDCTDTPSTPVCDTAANSCVACVANADCTSLTAPQCNTATNACVPCTADAACTGRTGTTVCDVAGGGECVQCTVANEAPCGANSCNPATNTCTTTPRGSVLTCRACTADSECTVDNRCVPMNFDGTPRAGGYCLKRGATGCVAPYRVPSDARVSLSGASAEVYCGVNEAVTTCEAVLDLIDDRACAPATDDDCGVPGLNDGRCRTVGGRANRCTYSCGTAADCPAGRACTSSYCGS